MIKKKMSNRRIVNILNKLYYEVDSPASYSSKATLYYHAKRKNSRITLQNVQDFLEAQHTYSKHKQVKRVFKRNQIIATGMDSHWQADLCDMKVLRKQNDKQNYILTVVDVLSKYGFAEVIPDKTPTETWKGFQKIMKRSGRKPWNLMVDKGLEFRGSFEEAAAAHDINLHVSTSPIIKAPNVERLNRILKVRLWKYFTANNTVQYAKVLQKIIKGINERYCRSIKTQPSQVTFKNEKIIWDRLYATEDKKGVIKRRGKIIQFKYDIGDRVRITTKREDFHKGYLPRFSNEIYIITERLARDPPVYRLIEETKSKNKRKNRKDQVGKRIFYHQDLVKVGEKGVRELVEPKKKVILRI